MLTADLFENPNPVESWIFLFQTGVFHIVSHRITSYRLTSYRITLYHLVSYRIMSYPIMSYPIMSYHIVSHVSSRIDHVVSYDITSYSIMSYRITSYRIVVNYIRAQSVTSIKSEKKKEISVWPPCLNELSLVTIEKNTQAQNWGD